MKIKPTGKAKLAYERGKRDRRFEKPREANPYIIYGSANDMQASWWITGWQDEETRQGDIKEIAKDILKD